MRTLQEHLDDLDRMVDSGTSVAKIRSQIAFIGREVAALQADYANLADNHVKLQDENSRLKPSQTPSPVDVPVDLSEEAVLLLQAIANAPDGAWKQELFPALHLHTAKGEFILGQLLERKFIEAIQRITPDGTPFQATSKGREYLNKKGLL
jgi:hypothetical protein